MVDYDSLLGLIYNVNMLSEFYPAKRLRYLHKEDEALPAKLEEVRQAAKDTESEEYHNAAKSAAMLAIDLISSTLVIPLNDVMPRSATLYLLTPNGFYQAHKVKGNMDLVQFEPDWDYLQATRFDKLIPKERVTNEEGVLFAINPSQNIPQIFIASYAFQQAIEDFGEPMVQYMKYGYISNGDFHTRVVAFEQAQSLLESCLKR